MRTPFLAAVASLVLAWPALAQNLPPECGNPYTPCHFVLSDLCAACRSDVTLEQLFDDGLHGDGAAGDGIWGADIVVDEPAGLYHWTVGSISPSGAHPAWPYCWCTSTFVGSARVWTSGPGDVVHFTLDLTANGGGWTPDVGIACDHCRPTTSPIQLVLDYFDPYDELTPQVINTTKDGDLWQCTVTVPTARLHDYVFAAADGSVIFSRSYDDFCRGGCDIELQPFASVTTTIPDTPVSFEFNEHTGRMRATALEVTPTRRRSWGFVKSIYR